MHGITTLLSLDKCLLSAHLPILAILLLGGGLTNFKEATANEVPQVLVNDVAHGYDLARLLQFLDVLSGNT